MTEYVGFDVSKEETAFCVKDAAGKILAAGKVATDPDALLAAVREHCRCPGRIVLETGTLSGWLARELGERGLAVEVIDARHAHALMRLQRNKSDAGDAAQLAEIARLDAGQAVAVRSETLQRDRAVVEARAHLQGQRLATRNVIRGLLGAFGLRFPKGAGTLAARVREALAERPELMAVVAPLLDSIEALSASFARLDDAMMRGAKESDACRLLMTVPGIGPVNALTFVATIGDAGRFADSRDVGAYLGLTTRRYQSGEIDYSGRISKRGDSLLRSLLYEAANCLLTRVRRAHPLKDWARRIARRSGHKKACVALARKLAVILHRMLITGEPFRWPQPAAA